MWQSTCLTAECVVLSRSEFAAHWPNFILMLTLCTVQGSRLAHESMQWLKDMKFGKNAWQIERADKMKPIADELGCSMAQLAVAFCLANPNVSTVVCMHA